MKNPLSTWYVILLAASLPAVSVGADAETRPADKAEKQKERLRTNMLVTTDWLTANLDKPDLAVLHVSQSRSGYDLGHVPGARFVGWQEMAVTRDGLPNELPPVERLTSLVRRLGVDDKTHVVVYDDDVGVAAGRAYVTFDYLGLGGRTSLLDGHWKKWKAEGRPVSKAVPKVEPSSYSPRVRPEVLVNLRAMRDLVWAKNHTSGSGVAIIDARSAGQFSGEEASRGLKRAGHVADAVSIPWSRNLVRPDLPVLRPVEELRAELAKAGVRPDDRAIVYCRTGARASSSYFLMKYLGYEVQLYDGSLTEWSGAEGTPMATGCGQ